MTTNQEEIKKLVRERYGAKARGVIELTPVGNEGAASCGDAGCCGPEDLDRAMMAAKTPWQVPVMQSGPGTVGVIPSWDPRSAVINQNYGRK